jgi:hypothetical protein
METRSYLCPSRVASEFEGLSRIVGEEQVGTSERLC